MPSPIAHCSIALALWPLVRESLSPIRWQRIAFGGLLLLGLMGPDLDIAVALAQGRHPFADHGGPWHSFAAGAIFALLFATVSLWLTRINWGWLWLMGAATWWLHVLLDAGTRGRGVAMLWPLSSQRVGLPMPLFYGVRHSEPFAWSHHLMTALTELPLVALMAMIGYMLMQRRRKTSNDMNLWNSAERP